MNKGKIIIKLDRFFNEKIWFQTFKFSKINYTNVHL